jgi:antitoxin CptB
MTELTKAKIKWRCHRGMLELDLLLMAFFDKHFDSLNDEQRLAFEQLLNEDDPDLFAWLMGHQEVENEEIKEIVSIIQHRVQSC